MNFMKLNIQLFSKADGKVVIDTELNTIFDNIHVAF